MLLERLWGFSCHTFWNLSKQKLIPLMPSPDYLNLLFPRGGWSDGLHHQKGSGQALHASSSGFSHVLTGANGNADYVAKSGIYGEALFIGRPK